MDNINNIMNTVGIPVYSVDENGVTPVNQVAKDQTPKRYSQEIERHISSKNDNKAVIFEQAGEVQPYRVELNDNGQGMYFVQLVDAQKLARDHVDANDCNHLQTEEYYTDDLVTSYLICTKCGERSRDGMDFSGEV